MDNKILYEILSSKSEKLSSEEIENILSDELEKSTNEMDTDLVDLCIEALSRDDKMKNAKKHHRTKLTKILVAAVVSALIIGISIPAGAKYLNIDVPDGVATFYEDYVGIKMPAEKGNGSDELALPEMFYSDEIEISNSTIEMHDNITKTSFHFTYNGISGVVNLSDMEEFAAVIFKRNETNVHAECIKVENINGINVMILSDDKHSNISYFCGNTECEIAMKCDFKTAKEISKTIIVGENIYEKINN